MRRSNRMPNLEPGKTYPKDIIYHKTLDDARVMVGKSTEAGKAEDPNDPGWVEGYLAVFNNVDTDGERIMRGAFTKSISERVAAGKVPLMAVHFCNGGNARDAIGLIKEAKEDDYGLWVRASFSRVASAQEIRTKTQEGIVRGMSVGFRVIRFDLEKIDNKVITNFRELILEEGTITCRPSNPLATITGSKAESAITDRLSAIEVLLESRLPSKPLGKTTGQDPTPPVPQADFADCISAEAELYLAERGI
jgi:hypothetical protein